MRRGLWATTAALFLVQQILGAGEFLHHHDDDPESNVPTLCHTCPHDAPCSSDRSHHHHVPLSEKDSHGLCPSCVHMFVQLPQESVRVTLPDGVASLERETIAPTPGEVHASTILSRGPPPGSSL